MRADIVIDLVNGDSGKGKVTHHLLGESIRNNVPYTHAVRYGGSSNAGHSIYHNEKKFVTHLIPAGVFFGIRSVIGPGCVLNVKAFFDELNDLKINGIDCDRLVKIAHNSHIVTDEHLKEDGLDTKIGTTKRGVGPAYRDKYGRTGVRAESIPELKPYLIDFLDEIFDESKGEANLMLEGAQGHYLDPIFGDYPYVTSSHCGVGGAIINGVPHTAIDMVFGACKAYDTYVGAKKFEPDGDDVLPLLRKVGSEFGATTGRPRQCNYLNLTSLRRACEVNDVTHLVVSKMDVLQEVNVWKVICGSKLIDMGNEDDFKRIVHGYVNSKGDRDVIFSYTPHGI
jgi:adenylosuccinate synthase